MLGGNGMQDDKVKYRRKTATDKRGRGANRGALPVGVERKPDVEKNGYGIEAAIRKQRRREKQLFPLRLNATTVLYVTADKCNEEYKQDYLKNKYRKL